VPLRDCDTFASFTTSDMNRRVMIMAAGKQYSLEVIDKNGQPKTPSKIFDALLNIVHDSKDVDVRHSIGILTTTDRNTWAEVRIFLFIGFQHHLDLPD